MNKKTARKTARKSASSIDQTDGAAADLIWPLDTLDGFSGLIFVKNTKGQLVYVNKNFIQLLGKQLDKILGQTDRQLGFPDHECARFEADDGVIMRGESAQVISEVENLTPGPDQEPVNLYTVKMPIRAGKVLRLFGKSAEDIYVMGISWFHSPDTRSAWGELTRAKQLLEALKKHSSDALYLKDSHGKYEFANDVFLKMIPQAEGSIETKLPPLETVRNKALGHTAAEVWHQFPDLIDIIRKEDAEIYLKRVSLGPKIRLIPLGTGGTDQWSSHKIPIIGRDGQVTGIFGISRELSGNIDEAVARRFRNSDIYGEDAVKNSGDTDIVVGFCDIRGFSKALADPRVRDDDVIDLITKFKSAVLKMQEKCGLQHSKFLGDGAMMLRIPEGVRPEDERAAIRSMIDFALMVRAEFRQEVRKWKHHLRDELIYSYDLEIGMGINYGKAIVARVSSKPDPLSASQGSASSAPQDAYGDTVNMAQRLESVAGKGGRGHVLISPPAGAMVADLFELNYLSGIISEKLSMPINAYEVIQPLPQPAG